MQYLLTSKMEYSTTLNISDSNRTSLFLNEILRHPQATIPNNVCIGKGHRKIQIKCVGKDVTYARAEHSYLRGRLSLFTKTIMDM